MIRGYLRQEATWIRTTGRNEYGEPIIQEKDIAVRWEDKRRLVRDSTGREVVSEARVYCTADVQPGDHLQYRGRRWPVIVAAITPGLDGRGIYTEVAL